MLRITVQEVRGVVAILLEGRLAGEWVRELEICWADTSTSPDRITIDLSGMTSIDERGIQLLERIHRSGTKLSSRYGPMTNYIVEQIQHLA